MTDDEKFCCICHEKKKFLALVNTGKKYYCMDCQRKITQEYGSDYWKPCSMEEGFRNYLSTRKNRVSFKEQMRQIREEAKNSEKDD